MYLYNQKPIIPYLMYLDHGMLRSSLADRLSSSRAVLPGNSHSKNMLVRSQFSVTTSFQQSKSEWGRGAVGLHSWRTGAFGYV